MTRVTVTADGSGVTLQPDWQWVHELLLNVLVQVLWEDRYLDLAREIVDCDTTIDGQPWQTDEAQQARLQRDALLNDLVDELRLDTSIRLSRIDGNCLVADLLRALASRIAGSGGADPEAKNGRSA